MSVEEKDAIVVVDDEPEMRSLLSDFLRSRGYSVECFSSATDFLDNLGHREVKAVVSDIHMKPMDGIELLKSVKKTRPEIPVVLMTAFSDSHDETMAKAEGAFGYLAKPFPLSALNDLLYRAIRQRDGVHVKK